jgi:20S proteasome alpha/beta subunit
VTVVLAVVCSDGVVIAADSQITDSGRGMSYPAQKLHPLGETAAWGGSGARSVLTDVERRFDEAAGSILESDDIGRAIQEQMLPVLRYHYDHFIPDIPGEATTGTPSAYLLAAGYDDGSPWIVEINPNGMVSRYEDIGFHAIGSGAPMAQQAGALLSHMYISERGTEYGVIAIVRVLDALSVTSPSVGAPFDVCRITSDGAHHLDEDEIEEAHGHVRRWEDLEQKALDDLFG